MQSTADHSTIDLTRTAGRISESVRFTPQVYHDQTFYHVRNSANGTWYRIGYDEYVFLSLCDGQTSFCEALALTAQRRGASALPATQAESLYRWAIEQGIVELTEDDRPRDQHKQAAGTALQKLNPFWIRIPIGRPERLLDTLAPCFNWLFSPLATLLSLVLMSIAAATVFRHADRFQQAAAGILAPDNWLYLLGAWVVLKLIHECGHAIVCRRYGGTVRQTGIILAFFAPLAYVDVTDSWAFRSRWQRIHTALAGIYVELLIASLAVFCWLHSDSAVYQSLAYNIVVMASLSTLLFNANPLMKFDGYYVLSDLLQIPNLYARASEVVQQTTSRLAYGTSPAGGAATGRQYWILLIYGVAAFCWRLFICASMTLTASVLLEGAGILLSALAIVAWFATPLLKSAKHFHQVAQTSLPRAARASIVLITICTSVAAGVWLLPVPFRNTVPGVVTLPDGQIVRAAAQGFIDGIHVSDGEWVQQGQLLVTLRHPETELRHRDQLLQLQQETIRLKAAQQSHDVQTAAVAADKLKSLQQQLAETQALVDGLQVVATTDGVVLARDLNRRHHTFVREGDELLCIDDGQSREVRLSVAEHDYAEVDRRTGQAQQLHIGTRPSMTAVLDRAVPRASRQLPFPSLAAGYGGPLAVRANNEGGDEFELTEQRFEATLTLPAASKQPAIGERGYIVLDSQHRTIGSWLYHGFRSWVSRQLEAASVGTGV